MKPPYTQPPYTQPPYTQPPHTQPPYTQPPYTQPSAFAVSSARPVTEPGYANHATQPPKKSGMGGLLAGLLGAGALALLGGGAIAAYFVHPWDDGVVTPKRPDDPTPGIITPPTGKTGKSGAVRPPPVDTSKTKPPVPPIKPGGEPAPTAPSPSAITPPPSPTPVGRKPVVATSCCHYSPPAAAEKLTSDAYSNLVHARAPELLDCYTSRGLTEPIWVSVTGQLSADGGTLQPTSVTSKHLAADGKTLEPTSGTDIAACVRPRVATWSFPKPSLRPPATSAIAHSVSFTIMF